MPTRPWPSRLLLTLLTTALVLFLPLSTASLATSAGASPGHAEESQAAAAQAQSRDAFVGAFLRAINKKRWDRVEAMVRPRWLERALKRDRRVHGKFERAGYDYPCDGDQCGIRTTNFDAYWMLTVRNRDQGWLIVDGYPND